MLQFSDLICGGIKERKRKVLLESLQKEARMNNLQRIVDKRGENTKRPSKKQKTERTVRPAKQLTFWVCKQYTPKHRYSSFCFKCCGTVLCSVS